MNDESALSPAPAFFSPKIFCETFGTSRAWFENAWRTGRVATVRIGHMRFVPSGEIPRLLAEAEADRLRLAAANAAAANSGEA